MNLVIMGSGVLIGSLMAADPIDEYLLMIHPLGARHRAAAVRRQRASIAAAGRQHRHEHWRVDRHVRACSRIETRTEGRSMRTASRDGSPIPDPSESVSADPAARRSPDRPSSATLIRPPGPLSVNYPEHLTSAAADLLGEVIRAWSGLRPRCDPFRKRERCVVLMEGISGERHLHANVARFAQQCALRKRGASRVDR